MTDRYRIGGFSHTKALGTFTAQPRTFATPAQALRFAERANATVEYLGDDGTWNIIPRHELRQRAMKARP